MLSKESKLEEEIVLHKASKKFLDLLAIASKNKKPVNQKKRRQMKKLLALNQSELQNSGTAAEHAGGGHTFVTQTSVVGKKVASKLLKMVGKTSFINKQAAAGGEYDDQGNRPS